jgi:hypothetical protein
MKVCVWDAEDRCLLRGLLYCRSDQGRDHSKCFGYFTPAAADMTEEQIRAELARSRRWGVNAQPEMDFMIALLRALPTAGVIVEDHDLVTVEFHRPLSGAEGFILARLTGADEPEYLTDPVTAVTLWWD